MTPPLERSVLTEADRVVTVSKDLVRLFEEKVPGVRTRWHVLPNGYDPADFSEGLEPNNDIFTLTYTGTLTLDYPVSRVEAALEQVLSSGSPLRLRLVGRPANEFVAAMESSKSAMPIFSWKTLGYRPHAESVGYLQTADA